MVQVGNDITVLDATLADKEGFEALFANHSCDPYSALHTVSLSVDDTDEKDINRGLK